jgi:hypothetical protein
MPYVHFSFTLIWDAILTIAGSQRTRPEPRIEGVRSCRFSSKRADKFYFRPCAISRMSRHTAWCSICLPRCLPLFLVTYLVRAYPFLPILPPSSFRISLDDCLLPFPDILMPCCSVVQAASGWSVANPPGWFVRWLLYRLKG